jgi:glycosyltransferase involved in cell wall biosynthesis
MKLAFLCFPHFGGTFTVYSTLRAGLIPAGIDIRWLGAGRLAHRALMDARWINEHPHGMVAGEPDDDERHRCAALVRAIAREFDGVLVNVLTSRAEMSTVRYLPRDVTRIMIVHSITPGTYAAARAIRDHVHATVGVSPRISRDLIRRFRFSPERTFTIPNAATVPLPEAEAYASHKGGLRLIYLGRIEDAAKGVFWLPKILDRLPSEITLTVAGDGPDLPELRKRSVRLANRITFLGRVSAERLQGLWAEHDVLLMPSRFEGSPLTLIEAMAAGCIPVVTRIGGVTDVIVTNGQDGILFRPGDTRAAASAIAWLAECAGRLQRMSRAARDAVGDRFTVSAMAERYLHVIGAARAVPPEMPPPVQLEEWCPPYGLGPGLRSFLPTPVKNLLRTVRERIVI